MVTAHHSMAWVGGKNAACASSSSIAAATTIRDRRCSKQSTLFRARAARATPNPSLEPTRYGRGRLAASDQDCHCPSLPTRAAQLER
jgi:hypothetical protein